MLRKGRGKIFTFAVTAPKSLRGRPAGPVHKPLKAKDSTVRRGRGGGIEKGRRGMGEVHQVRAAVTGHNNTNTITAMHSEPSHKSLEASVSCTGMEGGLTYL